MHFGCPTGVSSSLQEEGKIARVWGGVSPGLRFFASSVWVPDSLPLERRGSPVASFARNLQKGPSVLPVHQMTKVRRSLEPKHKTKQKTKATTTTTKIPPNNDNNKKKKKKKNLSSHQKSPGAWRPQRYSLGRGRAAPRSGLLHLHLRGTGVPVERRSQETHFHLSPDARVGPACACGVVCVCVSHANPPSPNRTPNSLPFLTNLETGF